MPNTRRRKFSVQTSLSTNNQRMEKSSQTSEIIVLTPEQTSSTLMSKPSMKNKISQKSSKINNSLEILTESDTKVIHFNSSNESISKVSKNVEANSSNIDLINKLQHLRLEALSKLSNTVLENHIKRTLRDTDIGRRERTAKQHRVKVRSPKISLNFNIQDEYSMISIGVNTIITDAHSSSEIEVSKTETTDDEIKPKETFGPRNSLEEMCRICHGGASFMSELGPLVSACVCRGTVGRVHVKCLEHWLTESGKSRCELCSTRYDTRRIHRYGVIRALIMWLFSQNAKQLIVDCLGIILMSPLAVFAAWLTGRTLAGLINKQNEVAPWPLASTFVLACMTLVCYYCWIVSAVTRHALGWWTWYRSQYEVRLNNFGSQ